jgi:hypothetical protein
MSNVTIGGRGGNPIPSTTLVATDQVTIFGDGSGQNPLTTNGGSGSARTVPVTVGDPTLGFPRLTPMRMIAPGPNDCVPCNAAASSAGATCSGLLTKAAIALAVDRSNDLFFSGPVDAPTADWDVVTGGSGGLSPGQDYYNDPANPGKLTTVRTSTSTQYISLIGVAFSPTRMLLNLPGAVQQVP